ncbi:hypothetical protein HMPREF1092_02813 [Clostridium thermobutyricum]|uniref:Uncharacterized protein n=1 Tax=Clostridium thermobutyricum TaxID=29372 RepID=N9XJ21_9CLOT|nr:hypothetical protein [Clostridium thermobutyricum]ENY99677.1 hypothetical protein HMPREF1092_02813 [Clostridium thermobutyricum]
MAKILNIKKKQDMTKKRYIVEFELENRNIAEFFAASYLMSIRIESRLADLYSKKQYLYLDTPNKDITIKLAKLLKEEIEKKN